MCSIVNRMKVISVINQKGGVGKTTTVINLGASLALLNKKTLIVDLDPQGNLSSGINLSKEDLATKNTYSALEEDGRLSENALPTGIDKLFAVGADSNLAGAEVELVSPFEVHLHAGVAFDQPFDLGFVFFAKRAEVPLVFILLGEFDLFVSDHVASNAVSHP